MSKLSGNQWKVIAAGALLVGALGVYFFWGREKPVLPDRINFVCVETGKRFSIPRDKAVVPGVNPDTGKATLVPCYERAGQLYADGHYRGTINSLAEVNRYVDPKTLQIRSAPQPK